MSNFNLILKKLKKSFLLTNQLIESFFDNFQKLKKIKISQLHSRIILFFGSFFVLVISYLSIPTFLDKNFVKSLIENQLNKKYSLKVKFNEKINYALFPSPHFFSKNLSIIYKDKKIGDTKNFKVFISVNNFFSKEKIFVKDILFKETEFNLNSENSNFFRNNFFSNKSDYEMLFRNSKVFYKNNNDDVLFLVKLKKLKFSREKESLNNLLKSNFEIFNVPFSIDVESILENKKINSKIKSKKIRLNIENEFNYDTENIDGQLDFRIINNDYEINYEINKKFLNFISQDESFKGKVDFKPFYFFSALNFNQLNLKEILVDNSIFINLINSELINNPNLNANLNINFKKILSSNYLKNFAIKTYLQEGSFFVRDSLIDWNDSVTIRLNEIELISDKDQQIKFTGFINFEFKDLTKFYSYYQISRNFRSNIKNIQLDFIYELNNKKIVLDNIRIDNEGNEEVNQLINEFNGQNKNIFNKVTFRNFIKDFFIIYEG